MSQWYPNFKRHSNVGVASELLSKFLEEVQGGYDKNSEKRMQVNITVNVTLYINNVTLYRHSTIMCSEN